MKVMSICAILLIRQLDIDMKLTQKYLKEILFYNVYSGMFTWRKRTHPNSRVEIGAIAGSFAHKSGYVYIKILGRLYAAHRLAYLHETGSWPKGEVDHINGNKWNNKWFNLRECTRSENMGNQGKRGRNKSGYKGVCWHRAVSKWYAQIGHNNKNIYLGVYDDIKDAARAYNSKALELFGDYAYLNEIKD